LTEDLCLATLGARWFVIKRADKAPMFRGFIDEVIREDIIVPITFSQC